MMRKVILVVSMASVLFILFASVTRSQDQKPAPAKEEPKAVEKPATPATGAPPAQKAVDQKTELRDTLTQLDNVAKTLRPAEQTAIEGDPALQAEKQALLDEVQQTIEKIKAFEQKVDDKVVTTSPDSKQLVEEKRDLVTKLEAMPQAKKGGMLGMRRLWQFMSGDKQGGRGKGERRGKGAAKEGQ